MEEIRFMVEMKEPTAGGAGTEQTEQPAAPVKPKKKHKWKRWIAIVLVVALVGGFLWKRGSAKPAETEAAYTQEAVSHRTIAQSITGSGTAQPADSYTVTSLVSGEVLKDTFEEGDLVSKDALLYTIDASDASTSVTSANLSYEQAVRAKYPTATQSGVIGELYVHNGDSVNAGTALCKIVSSNDLSIDFKFYDTNASQFYIGQSATLYISGFAGTLTGTVSAISETYSAEGSGMKLRTVQVTASNPGLVTEDCTAQASIGGYSNYGTTQIHLSGVSTVYSSGSGTVEGLTKLAGDTVQSGERLCTISSDNIDDQITNAKLNLDSSKDRLDNYTIKAPISGTVITKNVKAGDKLDTATAAQMAVIYDLSYLKVDLNIDELDINQVQEGQTVTITADAIDGTLTGRVDKVSIAGNTSGGVTTYPVTVIIEDYGDLRPGMNVDAEILITQSDDALAVPAQAVERGNKVLITSDSPSAGKALADTAPDGYVYVQVTTGISDDDYIEITSGLQEGDTVAYQKVDHSSDDLMAMMGGGDMGGDMGGAPSGGGPGGGPSGGPQG